jgi:hypothetical protein
LSIWREKGERRKKRRTTGNNVGDGEATEDGTEPDDPVLLGRRGEVVSAAKDTDVNPLGGKVAVDDGGSEKTGKGESVGDALDEDTGGTEGGRGDVLTGEEVDDDTDDDVERGDESLREKDGLGRVPRVLHLADNGEIDTCASIREQEICYCVKL